MLETIKATLPDMEKRLQEQRDSWQRHVGAVEILRLLITEGEKEASDAVPEEDDTSGEEGRQG